MTNESDNPTQDDNVQAAGENEPVLEFPSAEEIDQITGRGSGQLPTPKLEGDSGPDQVRSWEIDD